MPAVSRWQGWHSLILPFWSAAGPTGDESPHLWLIQAIFALPRAGGGPFEGEAMLVGILLGVLLLATILAFVVVASFAFATRPTRGWQRVVLTLVCLGSAGAWLLTFALTAHADRADNLIGAGLIAHTVGCALAVAAAGVKSVVGRR